MLRVLFISAGILTASLTCTAQQHEFGILGGGAYYIGELNPSTHVLSIKKPSVGLLYRYNINRRYSLKVQGSYNEINATDESGVDPFGNWRNNFFESVLWDFTTQLEFGFLPYKIGDSRHNFTPYTFIGGSFFVANPQGGNNAAPPPEDEEKDDNKMYKPAIPFGIGIRCNINGKMGFNVEWGMRKTFTDKLDNVNDTFINGYHKSNLSTNDWYSILMVSLNYRFNKEVCAGATRTRY